MWRHEYLTSLGVRLKIIYEKEQQVKVEDVVIIRM